MKNKIRRWVFGWLAGTFGITRSGASTVATPGSGGQVLLGTDGTATVPALAFANDTDLGLYRPSENTASWGIAGNQCISFDPIGIVIFSTGGRLAINDVAIWRDAAGVFAQRNGTAAQGARWYATYTDGSNYERLAVNLTAGGSSMSIAAETAGTGVDNIDILFTPAGTGNVRFGTHSALAAETVTGYITIKDSAGNTRKLAVVS